MSAGTRYPVPSRREFLKGVGAAGAGLVAGSIGGGGGLAGSAEADVRAASPRSYASGGGGAPASSVDFGRIFPNLPPFAEANDSVRSALLEVGQQGGVLDAQDDLTAGPKALIVDPTVNGNPTATNPYGTNPDNPTMTAGSTFVGQFTDHDITFDQTSQLGVPQNPLTSPNTRTPALDLDSVFGGGPGLRPDLYVDNPDGTVGPKLKIGSVVGPAPDDATHEDVPRVANGDGSYSALLGDPRNDENVMIAGLHCAHILFYNRVLDDLSEFDLSHFPAARAGDSIEPVRGVPDRAAGDAVALPVALGQRAPAADRRTGDRQRRAPERQPLLQPAAEGRVHADRVRRGLLPVRAQHGPPLLPGELHQRHRR